jgi:hypothetical protein
MLRLLDGVGRRGMNECTSPFKVNVIIRRERQFLSRKEKVSHSDESYDSGYKTESSRDDL